MGFMPGDAVSDIAKLKKTPAQKRAETKAVNIAKRRASLFAIVPDMALPPHVVIARAEARKRATLARARKIKKLEAVAADTRGNENMRAVAAAMAARLNQKESTS